MSSANIEKRCAANFLEAIFSIPEDDRCRSCNCRLTNACCRTGFPLRYKPAANASVRSRMMKNSAGRLYRIMNFHHVVQLFERKELFFAHPSSWQDPYETRLIHRE